MNRELTQDEILAMEFELLCMGDDHLENVICACKLASREFEKVGLLHLARKYNRLGRWLNEDHREIADKDIKLKGQRKIHPR